MNERVGRGRDARTEDNGLSSLGKNRFIALTRGVYERPHGRKVRRLEATYNRSWIKFHGRSARSRVFALLKAPERVLELE